MIRFLRRFWFELILAFVVLVFLVFAAVIIAAPHNDAKMRGFTPCTYEMAFRISSGDMNDSHLTMGQNRPKVTEVLSMITTGYLCYLKVFRDGFKQYLKNQQPTPWANYLFTPEVFDEDNTEVEPFSEDLLKANVLDDDEAENMLENKPKGGNNGQKDEEK